MLRAGVHSRSLRERSRDALHGILEDASRSNAAAGTEQRKVGDLYASYMDTAGIERLGIAPLQAELKSIAAVHNASDLPATFAHFSRLGVQTPLGVGVGQDPKRSDVNIVLVNQSGLVDQDDVDVRPLGVLADADTEWSLHSEPREMRERGGKVANVLDGGDALQLRLQRRNSKPLDASRVHVAGVQVADFALLGTGRSIGPRCILEDSVQGVAAALTGSPNAPQLDASAGMSVRFNQLPLTNRKKSSCGRTERSKFVVSKPSAWPVLWAVAGAKGKATAIPIPIRARDLTIAFRGLFVIFAAPRGVGR